MSISASAFVHKRAGVRCILTTASSPRARPSTLSLHRLLETLTSVRLTDSLTLSCTFLRQFGDALNTSAMLSMLLTLSYACRAEVLQSHPPVLRWGMAPQTPCPVSRRFTLALLENVRRLSAERPGIPMLRRGSTDALWVLRSPSWLWIDPLVAPCVLRQCSPDAPDAPDAPMGCADALPTQKALCTLCGPSTQSRSSHALLTLSACTLEALVIFWR